MATISPVLIANMALSNIGARSKIEDFSELSPEARQIRIWYDFSRLSTLEAYDWNFARKRLKLALHEEAAPEGQWVFRYQYPADCVNARRLENPTIISTPINIFQPVNFDQSDAVPFHVESSSDGTSNSILTDLPEATLIYTFDQEQSSMFTPYFVKSFSFHLASQIAIAITGKIALQDSMFEKWQILMMQASSFDANQGVEKPLRDADVIRART